MQHEYSALEINAPKIFRLLCALDKSFAELDYDRDVHGSFLVFDFPTKGKWALVPPIKGMTIMPGLKAKFVQVIVE